MKAMPTTLSALATLSVALWATTAQAADDADEFWDSDTVSTAIQISGALMGSGRLTLFPDDPDNLGQDELQFQIEHTHLKFSGDLTSKLSYEVMPCLTHMDSFSLLTANFTYQLKPIIGFTVGRFLLPFGGFNAHSLPGTYAPVSRPLLYQSHEDRTVGFDVGTPDNLFFTPRDDFGVQASGTTWLGSDDNIQVWYAAYLTNGPRPDSNTMSRHWEDNNNNKATGGRLVVSMDLNPIDIAVGASGLVNHYRDPMADDPESLWLAADQTMWSVDGELGIRWGKGRRLSFQGEYTQSHQQIIPTDTLAAGDSAIRGGYIEADTMLTNVVGVFAEYDHLDNIVPTAQINENFHDDRPVTNRMVGGLTLVAASGLQIKPEYGYWKVGEGLPVAHRISLQTVLTF